MCLLVNHWSTYCWATTPFVFFGTHANPTPSVMCIHLFILVAHVPLRLVICWFLDPVFIEMIVTLVPHSSMHGKLWLIDSILPFLVTSASVWVSLLHFAELVELLAFLFFLGHQIFVLSLLSKGNLQSTLLSKSYCISAFLTFNVLSFIFQYLYLWVFV